MTEVHLLTTKLYIPPIRPRLVSRPRLVERMGAGLHRKLTLLSAPAGFGKTTLLSECAACCQRPVAWLALDEADNDPTRFLAYLIAALQGIDAVGTGAQGALRALQARQAPGIGALLEGLINELAAVSVPSVLVLDDYHLIETETIHDALTFLLERLPPQMHLVISTRTDPPLPISRLRGRGQLTELRQNDLRFTHDEAARFLNQAMGLQLSAEDVAALASRTEGWIAGLQMAAVSMQGRDDPGGFVHAFSGSHRHVLDYLAEEVLMQQPDTIRDFLLRTAILDRLTGPLCDALWAGDAGQKQSGEDPLFPARLSPGTPVSSQEMLEYLERTNLFVVPLDEERRWYRYHHLFADLLRQRLQQTQPGSVPELHHRASIWCEQQGLMAEAVGHALSAEDFARALQLVELGAESAMMCSQVATLQGWVEALPDELVRTRPILCVYHTWALLLNGSPIEVAEARLQEAVDADPAGSIAGEVLALRALIATYQGKDNQSAELSRRALDLLPDDRLFFRSFIAGYLGYSTLHRGDLVAARQALEEAVRIGQQAGNLMNVVLALYHLGEVAMLEGHPNEAKEYYEQALAIAVDDRGQRQPIAGLALIGLGGLCILRHNLRQAARQITEGIERVNGWGKAGAISGYVALAHVKRVQGDLQGANEDIQTAERLAIEFSAMTVDDLYVATAKAHLWLAQGDVEAVARWIEELGLEQEAGLHLREMDGSGVIPFNRLLVHMLTARLHLAQDRPDEALRLLRPLRQMVETAGWTLYALRLLILEALALQQQGDIPEAMEPLACALELCDTEGFSAFFVEEGAPMVELLRHAASRGVAPGRASDLLARFETERGAALPSSHLPTSALRPQPLIEPLTERELDVLRFLATSLSTAEIADRLFVTVSTIRSHTKNIYAKLNVHRRWDAATRARELKLI